LLFARLYGIFLFPLNPQSFVFDCRLFRHTFEYILTHLFYLSGVLSFIIDINYPKHATNQILLYFLYLPDCRFFELYVQRIQRFLDSRVFVRSIALLYCG